MQQKGIKQKVNFGNKNWIKYFKEYRNMSLSLLLDEWDNVTSNLRKYFENEKEE